MSEWKYGDAVGGIRDSRGVCKSCGTYNEVHAKNCDYHPDKVLINEMKAEINRLNARVAELEQALDELGVTPAEAKAGVERSRAKTARIADLEQKLERIAKGSNWQAEIAREALGMG